MNETLREGEQVGVEARWNKALLQLSYGDLENGWENYEARWDWIGSRPVSLSFPPQDGRGDTGKSIPVWGEQGIGDEILFLTALPGDLELGPSKIGIYVR